MYKLKNVNGRVNALLRTGKDFVKNNLSVSAAQHIIHTGKLVESDNPDYPWNLTTRTTLSALITSGISRVSRSKRQRRKPS